MSDPLKKMAELQAAIEAAIDAAKAHADEHGLEFFLEGRGRYYGKGKEDFESSSVYAGDWDSSACW